MSVAVHSQYVSSKQSSEAKTRTQFEKTPTEEEEVSFLPPEIILHILSFLSLVELARVSRVSKGESFPSVRHNPYPLLLSVVHLLQATFGCYVLHHV